VKDFFRAWYTPENAAIAIAGDVTVARAKELVARWFGPLPSHAPPRHAEAKAVTLSEGKRVRLEDQVSFERLHLAWPSPRWFAPGDAELDLLATVLGGRGRLYQRLVYEQQIAQSVQVVQASSKLGSLFEIVATARPGHTAAELEAAIGAELKSLLDKKPIDDEELARARAQWEATFVYGLEGIERRADIIGQYYDGIGDAAGFGRDRARYLDASKDAIMKTAAAVLGRPHVTVVVAPGKPQAPAKTPAAGGAKGGR
jgi:zinc protease